MAFRITGLPAAGFNHLFGLSDAQLAAHGAIGMVAEGRPGFPCRVSLQEANCGERVLLLNFEHLAVATPYRSRHAIFVREHAVEARLEVDEVPEVMRARLLSLRAFDESGMMITADVTEGCNLAFALDAMLNLETVRFVHIHNAKAGCFAARADRCAD